MRPSPGSLLPPFPPKKHANIVLVWNARDGKFINTLRGHVAPVYQCAFSPDSRLLVTGSKDTTLKVWDMRTHKLSVGKSPLLLFHEIDSLIYFRRSPWA
jgi:WD40 repeat protein